MPALSMMMVISESRCDPLQNCCHASSLESRRSKGWCMSSVKLENLSLSDLTGKRTGRKNLLESIHRGYTPYITGNCSSVTGLELGTPFRIALVTANPGVKLKTRNEVRKERSWVKCYAKGVSRGVQKKDSGSQGSGSQQSDISEKNLPLKDGRTGEVRDRGGSEHFNQPHGPILGNEISKSEYRKIQDLRFSDDMWEGDLGPQVLDLQRALYWFGYLSKRTELTAYFGPETKKALQLFQVAYRVPGTGAWGSSSRQALWKILNEESSSFSEGESSVHSNVQQSGTTFINNVHAGELDAGIRVSELVNNMGAHSQEFMSTLSSAPCWRYLPMKVPRNAAFFGLFVGMLATLFGLGYSVVGMLHEQHGQPVRRRVLIAHWRDDLTGTTSTKPKRRVDTFPGIDSPVVGEADYKHRLRSKPRSISTTGTGRTDRLILYEGQVLVGDESPSSVHPFLNGSASRRGSGKTASQGPYRAKASSIHEQTSNKQANRKPANDESVLGPRGMNFQGSQISSKRTNNLRVRSENHSMTRVDPGVVGNAVSRPSQNFLHLANPMEQSNEKQPSFVRGLLSALFTPKGLGNSTGLEKPEPQRISSSSPQLDASDSEEQVLDNYETEPKVFWSERSSNSGGNSWQGKDEENLKDRVEELRKSVQAAEVNRQAAIRALADERQRSLELQVKISRQKETAAALEEEVRVLKESHDALLASLRKKYSSSVAARAAAALLYQNWDTDYEEGSPQTISY